MLRVWGAEGKWVKMVRFVVLLMRYSLSYMGGHMGMAIFRHRLVPLKSDRHDIHQSLERMSVCVYSGLT